MKTLELINQLHLRFGKGFVDLLLLERQLRGLTITDDSDLLELEEEFRALAVCKPADNSALQSRYAAAATVHERHHSKPAHPDREPDRDHRTTGRNHHEPGRTYR